MRIAGIVLNSGNAKLGKGCATTYASIVASCPASCALRDEGCYAQDGRVGMHVRRLDARARDAGADARDAAREEARAIIGALPRVKKGTPLRLHTAGDCRTPTAARLVSEAAAWWPGPVWTYTHAWRDVIRNAWGRVSVLASCETATEALQTMRRGYAAALVVREHPPDGRATTVNAIDSGRTIRLVPCPAQTREGVTCSSCRLCWDARGLLQRRTVITFAAHGGGAKRVRLNVLQS